MFKDVASQKVAVFAWDSANSVAKTGDAAQISAQISKDGAATAATDDVAPTELDSTDAPGIYIFDMLQAETNADLVVISPVSSTGDIDLRPVILYTQAVMATALTDIGLDHLVSTSVTGTDIADNSILAKLVSASGTADWDDFVNTTDSLQAIRDGIVAANPQNHSATADNQTEGTTTGADGYAETATADNDYYQTQPEATPAGSYGLDIDLTFGVGTGRIPSALEVTGFFNAGALRTVQVWAYDYDAAAYVQLSNSTNDFGHRASNITFQYSMTANMVQVSDGEVKIRFTSTSTTTGDDFYCDYVNVSSVDLGASGLTADAIQAAVWNREDSGHDEDTLGYNLSKVHVLNGDVVSATSTTQFIIDAGHSVNDAYNGMVIMLEDKTDDHYEVRRIIDYIGSTNEVFVDRALGFTPVAGDDYYIMATGYSDVNVTSGALTVGQFLALK